MTSYKDIKRQIADLEKKAAEAKKIELAKVIASIQKQIEEYELTPADLFKGALKSVAKGAKKSGKSVNPPKYMDPKTGKTWTGFGKAPAWITAAVKKGRKEDFLIEKIKEQQGAKAAAKPTVKTADAKKAGEVKKAAKPVATKTAAKPAAAKPAGGKEAAKSAAAKTAPAKAAAPKKPKAPAAKPAAPAAEPIPAAAPASEAPAATPGATAV